VALALLFAMAVPAGFARANHLPADKIGVSASVVEVMTATASPTGPVSSGPVVLLEATLRNSSPTDLIVEVTGECALWTEILSPASEAKASVKVWTEIDGNPIPVTSDSNGDGVNNDPDDGRVVFCNRDFQVTSLLTVDVLRLFLGTRSANSFNWITLNVGSGIHSIVVKGQLDVQVAGTGYAKAAVGKRTLVVQPAKLANDATVSMSDPAGASTTSPALGSLRWGAVAPNPFQKSVDLELFSDRAGPAAVDVYDVGGHRVAKLFTGKIGAVMPRLRWDGLDRRGRPVPPGVYLVKAEVGSETVATPVCRMR